MDVTGAINTTGTFTGTIDQPELAGNIVFADGTFNQKKLSANIVGDYSYQDQKLNFNITSPESIQIAATVPYPIQPQVNDQITANVKLTTEAFTVLDSLTQNNLTWIGGEGNVEIVTTANIDLNRKIPIYNIQDRGEVNLNQAEIKIANINETLTATGKITLNNQVIDVESLNGTIGNKDLSVTGQFPLLYAVNNLENPLTINIPPGDIELQELYQGGVAGNIILTGTALEPVISGEVALEDGEVSIPNNQSEQDSEISEATNSNSNNNNNSNNNSNFESSYQVLAKDFLVKLDEFRLDAKSLDLLELIDIYGFKVRGELNVNGTLNNISQLKGEGTLELVGGVVGWLTSDFSVVRNRDNLIVFTPDTEITNPSLDIQLRTNVDEYRQLRQLEPEANAVPDDISNTDRIQKIDVRVNIYGTVQEILGAIAQTGNCDISPDNLPIAENDTYSNAELEKLDDCLKSDRNLVNVSAITLSSTPSRSEGEIVNLLGYQSLSLFSNGRNNGNLLDLAFSQFVFKPLERRFLYQVEDFFVNVGQNIGIDYLRIVPFIEVYSRLGNSNFYILGIYDANVIKPQSDSTDANNTNQVYEAKLEYRLKF